uniref:Sulfhydryl oxidase n=1 Tax=Florenciella sp. virus SA2 TaxID=3240092 RepID=A0AB39JC37_9VIRU
MKKAEWGPVIWNLLHCITLKIKDEYFDKEKPNLINMIENICSNLPCPMCASSALKILKTRKISSIKNKDQLIIFIFLLHNEVNKKTKKPIAKKEIVDTYKTKNFINILNEYYNLMNHRLKYNERLMYMIHRRKSFINTYRNYFKNNINKFDN